MQININFDKIIYRLLCFYAFFIPLEKILEVLFGIDTILKPYRIAALLILGTFVIKLFYRWNSNKEIKQDMFLYLIFIYGIVITLYRMITTKFYLGHLYNDVFQMGIYLGVFVVMRHTSLDIKKMSTIIKFFAIGVIINAGYVFYNFYFLKIYRRGGGLMDNANYLALSLVAVITLLLLQRKKFEGLYKKIVWLILFTFLVGTFIIAGSRTGLAILSVCFLVIFYFLSIKQKGAIMLVTIVTLIILQIGGSNAVESTGPLVLINRIQLKKTSVDDRIYIWKGAVNAAKESNFLGLGIGQFQGRFREFYYQENNLLIRRILERNYFLSPHSDYLALLVAYGVIGLVFYLLFLITTGSRILQKIRNSINIDHKLFYQNSLLILITLALFGITSESFNSALYWVLLSTCSRLELA